MKTSSNGKGDLKVPMLTYKLESYNLSRKHFANEWLEANVEMKWEHCYIGYVIMHHIFPLLLTRTIKLWNVHLGLN